MSQFCFGFADVDALWERADASGEQCAEFLRMVVQDVLEKGKKVRGPYLAYFELYSKLKERNADTESAVGKKKLHQSTKVPYLKQG